MINLNIYYFISVLIPTWVFSLGGTIFADRQMEVPYEKLLSSGLTPLISLMIGFGIQVMF